MPLNCINQGAVIPLTVIRNKEETRIRTCNEKQNLESKHILEIRLTSNIHFRKHTTIGKAIIYTNGNLLFLEF